MANDNTAPTKRLTTATTKCIQIPLDGIKLQTEHFCHRAPAVLKPESLASLMHSLANRVRQNLSPAKHPRPRDWPMPSGRR